MQRGGLLLRGSYNANDEGGVCNGCPANKKLLRRRSSTAWSRPACSPLSPPRSARADTFSSPSAPNCIMPVSIFLLAELRDDRVPAQ